MARVVLFVLACVLLSACSMLERPVTVEQVEPFERLAEPPPELALAVTLVAVQCMAEHGHALPVDLAPEPRRGFDVLGIDGVFRDLDAALARGYPSTVAVDQPLLGQYRSSLSADERTKFDRDYFGVPEDGTMAVDLGNGLTAVTNTTGCLADGRRAVYGDLDTAMAITEFRNQVLGQRVAMSSAMHGLLSDVIPKYEACMADAGYPVTGLGADDLAGQRLGRYRQPSDPPNAAEKALVRTDFRCQDELDIRQRILTVFADNAGAWIRDHEAEVQGWQEKVNESLVRARRIIAGRG